MKNYQIYGNSRASPKVCKNQDMGRKLVSFIDLWPFLFQREGGWKE